MKGAINVHRLEPFETTLSLLKLGRKLCHTFMVVAKFVRLPDLGDALGDLL